MAELIAALAVPVSMPLGPVGKQLLSQAIEPWTALHAQLVSFGWADREKYAAEIRRVLDGG
jgi:hypothetical protein